MKRLIPLALLAALPFAAAAQTTPPADPQAQKARFEQFRALDSERRQERIRILQEADACISRAETPDTYRACKKSEREAHKAVRDRMKTAKGQKRMMMRAERKGDCMRGKRWQQ